MLSLALLGSAQAHRRITPSTVTLAFAPSPYGDAMSGDVGSAKPACKSSRSVSLYRSKPGDDKLYATTTTKASGHYQFEPEGKSSFKGGSYYSKVARKVLKRTAVHRHVCGKARSVTVTAGGSY